jgi:hypothetical protein
MGNWKPGEKATLKIMMALRYYKITHGGDVVHEIDIPNMVRTLITVTDFFSAMSGWLNDVIFFGLHNQLLKYLARNEPQITDRHRQWCEPCWG